MTDNDIEETLKEKWAEVLDSYNDELITQQLKSFDTK